MIMQTFLKGLLKYFGVFLLTEVAGTVIMLLFTGAISLFFGIENLGVTLKQYIFDCFIFGFFLFAFGDYMPNEWY
jgi:hypothetical protein